VFRDLRHYALRLEKSGSENRTDGLPSTHALT
jgi:hypothetical protein